MLVSTFLSVAAEPWPTNFKFPSLDIKVIPDPEWNKKFPAEEVWKNSYSAPIGAFDVVIEHVNCPPTIL